MVAIVVAGAVVATLAIGSANAATVVDEWPSVKAPAPAATVLDFETAPLLSNKTTLTKSDMIKF